MLQFFFFISKIILHCKIFQQIFQGKKGLISYKNLSILQKKIDISSLFTLFCYSPLWVGLSDWNLSPMNAQVCLRLTVVMQPRGWARVEPDSVVTAAGTETRLFFYNASFLWFLHLLWFSACLLIFWCTDL